VEKTERNRKKRKRSGGTGLGEADGGEVVEKKCRGVGEG
jgi:hypothetical protein